MIIISNKDEGVISIHVGVLNKNGFEVENIIINTYESIHSFTDRSGHVIVIIVINSHRYYKLEIVVDPLIFIKKYIRTEKLDDLLV
jgi:hypothetical protein